MHCFPPPREQASFLLFAPQARIAPSALPSPTTATPSKPTAKKHGKRKTKARNLSRTLTPLADFRQLHTVTEKAIENGVLVAGKNE
jgi:hypothetical protein